MELFSGLEISGCFPIVHNHNAYVHVQSCAVLTYKIRNVRPQVQSSQLLEKGLLYGGKVC